MKKIKVLLTRPGVVMMVAGTTFAVTIGPHGNLTHTKPFDV